MVWSSIDTSGCILYSIALLCVILSVLFHIKRASRKNKRWKIVFHALLLGFCLVRVLWYIDLGEEPESSYGDLLLNRLALLLFFSAFSLVFFWQVEDYGRRFGDDYVLHWRYFVLYTLVNLIIYTYEIIMAVLYTLVYLEQGENYDRQQSVMYDVEILTIVCYNFVLAISFGIIGVLRMGRLYYSGERQRKEIVILAVHTFLMVSGFTIRTVMWSLRVLFDTEVSNTAWAIFGYWVPELLPLTVQLLVIVRDLRLVNAVQEFTYDLYDQMTDNESALINDQPNTLTYQTKTSAGEIQRIQVRLYSEDDTEDEEGWPMLS